MTVGQIERVTQNEIIQLLQDCFAIPKTKQLSCSKNDEVGSRRNRRLNK